MPRERFPRRLRIGELHQPGAVEAGARGNRCEHLALADIFVAQFTRASLRAQISGSINAAK